MTFPKLQGSNGLRKSPWEVSKHRNRSEMSEHLGGLPKNPSCIPLAVVIMTTAKWQHPGLSWKAANIYFTIADREANLDLCCLQGSFKINLLLESIRKWFRFVPELLGSNLQLIFSILSNKLYDQASSLVWDLIRLLFKSSLIRVYIIYTSVATWSSWTV